MTKSIGKSKFHQIEDNVAVGNLLDLWNPLVLKTNKGINTAMQTLNPGDETYAVSSQKAYYQMLTYRMHQANILIY